MSRSECFTLLRTLSRGRRIVALLLTSVLVFPSVEAAVADAGTSSEVQVVSAPIESASLPDAADCPLGCACPCICACPGVGAVLPTGSLSEADKITADETVPLLESMPVANFPEPLFRPPAA